MSLAPRLTAELKNAMLTRDTVAVSVLRMFQSELKNATIAKGGELAEADEVQILRKEIKKRTEAATLYREHEQPERAAAEQAEAEVLRRFLPEEVSPETISAFLEQISSEYPSLQPQHRGELIRRVMQQFPGQVDGKTVADLVGKLFA